MAEQPDELTLEEYQAAKDQFGSEVLNALDRHAAKMAFNVLYAYDMPEGVRGYLHHARTLLEVAVIWAVAHGYVELTEKGKANLESEPEGNEPSFSLPSEGGNVVPLHPTGGQYL